MRFTELLKLTEVYLLIYVVSSIVYVLLFSTPLFGGMDVFFYRGIALLFAASLISAGLGFMARKFWLRHIMTYRDILLIFTIFICVNMVFFTHVPVTAERSISVFMLGYMSEEDRVFTEKDIEDFFISRYVKDYRMFEKRFHEQIVTGTIRPEGGGNVLTDRGKSLVKFYNFIADCFHVDKKLIHPVSI